MSWETPKTDWYGAVVDNVYTGDRFNYTDYNRIKNNLVYLRNLAIKMYDEFSINDVGSDKSVAEYYYAEEINQMEENLEIINSHTLAREYGDTPTYADNGNTPDYTELNRLESAIFDLYDRLSNQSEGRRTFEWNFGVKGGL